MKVTQFGEERDECYESRTLCFSIKVQSETIMSHTLDRTLKDYGYQTNRMKKFYYPPINKAEWLAYKDKMMFSLKLSTACSCLPKYRCQQHRYDNRDSRKRALALITDFFPAEPKHKKIKK